jgi:guanylate kinase
MSGYLFILSGASGCGKTTLMNDICNDSTINGLKAAKYSERESRGSDDDIQHVERIEIGDYDLAYVINDKRYGIKTTKIKQELDSGKNAFIILSDFRVTRKVKSVFGEQAKTIYISSAIDPQSLLKVHGTRHAFSPSEEQKKALHNQFSRLKSAARLELWPSVFKCMSELLDDWRKFIPDSQSAEIRAQKIRSFHNRYIDKIVLFDHVILNIGDPSDMTNQMKNLIHHYDARPNPRIVRPPALFVVAAASGAGKGLLTETLRSIIGQDQVSIVAKMAKREPKPNDRRDGMTAIGEQGEFPPSFDFTWRFHQTEESEGTEYAVSTDEIRQNIANGKQQILISNMNEFARFRELFGDHAVFLYLHALRPEEDIRAYQYARWSPTEAETRIAEIRKVHDQYIERIAQFNHVLLNTAYPEDLFDQMFELVEYYETSKTGKTTY